LVIAKDEDPSRENKNMSLWLIKRDTPGIKTRKIKRIGQQIMPFCEMIFDNVIIDESCLVGDRGKGFLNLMRNFEIERLLASSMSLGLAQRAMEEAAVYAGKREAFEI
jgi:crotonobetainyl-CoA dehydrogenase